MKYGLIILISTLSWGFGQCDANGDGDLDVLDVVTEVNCIMIDCWEGEPSICDGLTEVELWGETFDTELTNYITFYNSGLTGEIPPEVCDLIESNNLNMDYILEGNENLINTCEETTGD